MTKLQYEPAADLTSGQQSITGGVTSGLQVTISVPTLAEFTAWAKEVEAAALLYGVDLPFGNRGHRSWSTGMIEFYTADEQYLGRLAKSYCSCRVTQAQHVQSVTNCVKRMLQCVDMARKADHKVTKAIYGKSHTSSEFPL